MSDIKSVLVGRGPVSRAGEALLLSSAAMELASSGPVFGAVLALWAASLFLLSMPGVAASWVRVVGALTGLLFSVVAVWLFVGLGLTPLSRPLPFFAYPVLDRYAARNANFVHVASPHSGRSRAKRGKRYWQPAKGSGDIKIESSGRSTAYVRRDPGEMFQAVGQAKPAIKENDDENEGRDTG